MKKLLALFLSLVLLLSACSSVSGSVSGPGNSQSSEDTEPGTKGKLSILYMSGDVYKRQPGCRGLHNAVS